MANADTDNDTPPDGSGCCSHNKATGKGNDDSGSGGGCCTTRDNKDLQDENNKGTKLLPPTTTTTTAKKSSSCSWRIAAVVARRRHAPSSRRDMAMNAPTGSQSALLYIMATVDSFYLRLVLRRRTSYAAACSRHRTMTCLRPSTSSYLVVHSINIWLHGYEQVGRGSGDGGVRLVHLGANGGLRWHGA